MDDPLPFHCMVDAKSSPPLFSQILRQLNVSLEQFDRLR